jgi:hypothetical protein
MKELPLRITLSEWDQGHSRWNLQPALAINANKASVWIDGVKLADDYIELKDGAINLKAHSISVTDQTKATADIFFRRAAYMTSEMQALFVALIGIVPALLTFFFGTSISAHRTPPPSQVGSVFTIVTPKDKLTEAIRNAKELTLVSNWPPQWVTNGDLQSVIARGGNVEMIFPSPDSLHLRQRSIDLGHDKDPEYAKRRLMEGLNNLGELYQRLGATDVDTHLTIQTHGELAPSLLLRCDDIIFIGPFLHHRQVGDSFVFGINIKQNRETASFLLEEIAFLRSKGSRLDLKRTATVAPVAAKAANPPHGPERAP